MPVRAARAGAPLHRPEEDPVADRPAYRAGSWWTGDEDMDWVAEFDDTGGDGVCSAAKLGKLTCQQCWVYCPEACVAQGTPPAIDLTYCKGCGICAEVCPVDAITMVPEAAAEGAR